MYNLTMKAIDEVQASWNPDNILTHRLNFYEARQTLDAGASHEREDHTNGNSNSHNY